MTKLSRRDFLKVAGIGGAGLASMFALAACGGDGETTGSTGSTGSSTSTPDGEKIQESTGVIEGVQASAQVKTLTAALTGASFDIGPFGGASGARDWICQVMYASLMCAPKYGASLEELQPWLAKSVTKVDDVTFDIELYDNIVDSKGNPIKADDIIFSYDQMAQIGEITTISTDMKSLTKVDDTHLQMVLTAAGNGSIEGLLSFYRHTNISQAWYEGAGDDEKQFDPATTGAYKVVEYVAGSKLTLEAVEDYWFPSDVESLGAKQNAKTIYLPVITEGAMRSIALENKEIDATQITASELQRFYVDGAPLEGWNVLVNGGNMFGVVGLNMDESQSVLATDINLRKAILHAINCEDLIYAGGGDLTTSAVCKTAGSDAMGGYNAAWEDEEYFEYDLEKAKEYMAQSNYPDGVTLRFLCRTGSTADATNAVYINAFEQIGITIDLLCVDQALFNQYKFDSTQWDIITDSKQCTGHITQGWNDLFNPAGYSNGSWQFTHDDKLVELLKACFENNDPAATDEFHYYLKDQAYMKATTVSFKFTVGQDGILQLTPSNCFNPRVNAYVFADDYVGVAD